MRALERSAEAGHAAAAYLLGTELLLQPEHVKSERPAIYWLRKAADAGEARALGQLGNAYRIGEGGAPRDRERGRELLREAAEAGDPHSCMNLYAMCIAKGDRYGAERWLRRAVALGDRVAPFELARVLLQFQDPQRCREALCWLVHVLQRGPHEGAALLLGQVYLKWGAGCPSGRSSRAALAGGCGRWNEVPWDCSHVPRRRLRDEQGDPADLKRAEAYLVEGLKTIPVETRPQLEGRLKRIREVLARGK